MEPVPQVSVLGRFPNVRTGRPDHGRTGHFENETGFFQEFLMENDFLLILSWCTLFRI